MQKQEFIRELSKIDVYTHSHICFDLFSFSNNKISDSNRSKSLFTIVNKKNCLNK